MKVAVVILNWNGRKLLEQFLPSVIENSRGIADVFVADNNSADDSVSYLENNYPEIQIIINDKNYGFAGGYNKCLEKIEAEYFVLLNSDMEVSKGWIDPVIEMMDHDKTIGACQPKIKSFHDKNYFEYAGASGGFIDNLGYPFCRGRIFNSLEKDSGQYDNPAQVFWASGACMFVRAEIFKKLNGFDETFFAHMEEIDLCWRIQRNGFKIMVQPAAVVYHVGGGTLHKSNPGKTYLNFRNNMLMLHKNLPLAKLFPVMFLRLILDGIAGIKFLFSDSPADCFAVIKAHFYFYVNLPAREKIRRANRPSQESEVKGVYGESILASYYFKGIKKFDALKPGWFR